MWKLVKSEILYFRWLYIISMAVVLIINTGLTIDGKWIEAQDDFPGLRVIWMGVGIVVLFFAILFNRKSGRLRTNNLVPLNNLQISFARIIPFILFWISLMIILIFFCLINFAALPTINWLVNLISISGIMLLINSIPILYSDFYSTYFTRKSKVLMILFWSIIWIIYVWMNVIFMTYLDFISPEYFVETRESLKELYFTPTATIANILIGFFMFFLSIITFRKRKHYLE